MRSASRLTRAGTTDRMLFDIGKCVRSSRETRDSSAFPMKSLRAERVEQVL